MRVMAFEILRGDLSLGLLSCLCKNSIWSTCCVEIMSSRTVREFREDCVVAAAGLWKGKSSVTIRLELSTQCQLSNRRSYFKVTTSIIKIPKEICDLSPVKSCSLSTKLVPSLAPVRKCSRVPRHYCHKTYVPRRVKKPIIIKWCIEEEQEEQEEQEQVIRVSCPSTLSAHCPSESTDPFQSIRVACSGG